MNKSNIKRDIFVLFIQMERLSPNKQHILRFFNSFQLKRPNAFNDLLNATLHKMHKIVYPLTMSFQIKLKMPCNLLARTQHLPFNFVLFTQSR